MTEAGSDERRTHAKNVKNLGKFAVQSVSVHGTFENVFPTCFDQSYVDTQLMKHMRFGLAGIIYGIAIRS